VTRKGNEVPRPDRAGDDTYTAYVSVKLPWLRRVAYLLCQDSHRADDLVQTSLTKLYVHWRRVEHLENLDGYIRTILLNTYLAEQRTSWWRRVISNAQLREDADPNADDVAALETAIDLAAALAALPPGQRVAIVLRHYCDLSVEETAEMLACSAGNVKSQTSRGLASLRSALTPGGDR